MISLTHIHPMLVHFPIALVAVGFIADAAAVFIKKEPCLSKLGFYLLITGTLAAITVLCSGIFFTSEMSGSAGEIKSLHELFAWITVVTLLVTSALRIMLVITHKEASGLKWIAFVFYGLAAVSVGLTGFFGGTLVYNYMMPL